MINTEEEDESDHDSEVPSSSSSVSTSTSQIRVGGLYNVVNFEKKYRVVIGGSQLRVLSYYTNIQKNPEHDLIVRVTSINEFHPDTFDAVIAVDFVYWIQADNGETVWIKSITAKEADVIEVIRNEEDGSGAQQVVEETTAAAET